LYEVLVVRRIEDAYILRLDDLPKVVEADGMVFPVLLALREAARVFHVPAQTLRTWIDQYEIPVTVLSGRIFIDVAALNEFITDHSMTPVEYREYKAQQRAARQKQWWENNAGRAAPTEQLDDVEHV
jgi:hypothetical protein